MTDVSPASTVLLARRVLDPAGGGYVADAAVVIEGDRIAWVGPRDGRPSAPADRVIDCGDRTIVPGLMDAHVHLFRSVREPIPDAEAAIRAAAVARQALRSGLTTVRDLGTVYSGIWDLSKLIERGEIPGPRIVAAGAGVAMTGGHGDGSITRGADGPDEVVKAVRTQIKAGAGVIKMMATGGTSADHEHFGHTQLTLDELKAGVAAAHAAARPVAIHAMNADGARAAVEAGADSIEHGTEIPDDVLAEMAARGTALVPTLGVYDALAAAGPEKGISLSWVARARRVCELQYDTLRRARAAGVTLVFGTDGARILPIGALDRDIELWRDCGVTATEMLAALTINAARLLRIDDIAGSIEAGKVADLLVVDGDPLSDAATLTASWLVVRAGRPYGIGERVPGVQDVL